MTGIEEMLEKAAKAAENEKLALPFSYDSLNTAYVLMRDQHRVGKPLFVPDELRAKVEEDSSKEMGLAESNLHSFMGTLVWDFWDGNPVKISMTAEGRCPLHPNDKYLFTRVLDQEAVGKIKTPDSILTSETIGRCPLHPDQRLYADVSALEYSLKNPEEKGDILKFQSRIKLTKMVQKLTKGIIGYKPYALDFRGGRVICRDFDSYAKVSDYLLTRVANNGTIHRIPVADSIEEHVAKDRDSKTYLGSLLPGRDVPFKEEPYYESLHLLIRYMDVPIELQCRDQYMHEDAEKGRAAHEEYELKELARVRRNYPDYDSVNSLVGDVYKALIPAGFKLFQEPFSPSAHN